MITFYVDDGFIFGKALPKGIRYNSKTNCLEMSTAQLKLDQNTPPDIRMANIFLAIGNTIDKDIQLTADSPSMNDSNYMPLLDTQVTLQTSTDFPAGEIIFRHYRKPMASKLTIQKDSALPLQQKITILTQEVLRIFRNTHPRSGMFWKKDLGDLMQRLFNSGWDEAMRTRVLKAGIVGWCKILNKEFNEGIPRYRHVTFNRAERDRAKQAKKDNWFKSKNMPEDQQAKSVLIVDASPGGEIKAIFEEEIAKTNLKIRVIERPGSKHQFITMATNENKKPKCLPETCLVCDTEKGGYCRAKEVVYEIACKSCKCVYNGQTGRNAKTRALEHQAKAKSNNPKTQQSSFMYKHQHEDHEGEDQGWNMKVLDRCPKDPLTRLLKESYNISNVEAQYNLNSRVEMAQSNLIRVNFISDSKKEKEDKIKIQQALTKSFNKQIKHKITDEEQTPMEIEPHPSTNQAMSPVIDNIQTTPTTRNIQTNQPKTIQSPTQEPPPEPKTQPLENSDTTQTQRIIPNFPNETKSVNLLVQKFEILANTPTTLPNTKNPIRPKNKTQTPTPRRKPKPNSQPTTPKPNTMLNYYKNNRPKRPPENHENDN